MSKLSRNDPCPCSSGRKYKRCCLRRDNVARVERVRAIERNYRAALAFARGTTRADIWGMKRIILMEEGER